MPHVDNKRIAKNTLLLYGRMGISMLVSLYTSRIVLEALGFSDFGIYNVVGGIVGVFTTVTASLSGATARFITLELGKTDRSRLPVIFSTAVWLHIFIAIIIVIFCEAVGVWFLNTQLEIPSDRMVAANWVFQFSIIAAVVSFTQVPYTATMIAHERMAIFAYVGLFSSFGGLAIAFLIKHAPLDRLVWYGLLTLLLNITSMLLSRFYCMNHFNETHLRIVKDRQLIKEMLRFSGYDLIGNISVMAQGQGLNIVLNMFYGPMLNAARAIAYRIQMVTVQFTSSFTTALRPQVYRLYAQNETEELVKIVKRGAMLTFMLLLLPIIPVGVNLPDVLHLWLGQYPAHTVSFCEIVLLNTLFSSFGSTRLMVFHASGNIKAYSLSSGTIMTLALPIGYVLLKLDFPPISVFGGMLATTIASDVNSLILLRRYLKYSFWDFVKQVHVVCFSCAMVSLTAAWFTKQAFIRHSAWISVSASSLVAIIITTLFMWRWALTESQRSKILIKLKLRK